MSGYMTKGTIISDPAMSSEHEWHVLVMADFGKVIDVCVGAILFTKGQISTLHEPVENME